MLEKFICPFDFQEFVCRGQLDVHLSNRHTRAFTNETELLAVSAYSSSESEISSDDPPPELIPKISDGLSYALKNIKLPNNPLSDIGELSENRLLRITQSPCIGELTEVIFT